MLAATQYMHVFTSPMKLSSTLVISKENRKDKVEKLKYLLCLGMLADKFMVYTAWNILLLYIHSEKAQLV